METRDRNHSEAGGGFWRSRLGIALLVFFAIAALLLGYEHRVHLFVGNGLLVLLLLGCVGMHFFMHGHKHRMLDGRVQAMPGDDAVWLVGERRSTGERKYYVSNLSADATIRMLAAAIKAR